MKTAQLSRHRDAVAIFFVVIAVTGFNLWQHRGDPPPGYVELNRYGFRFFYPDNCPLREALVYPGTPSYSLGDIQGESSGASSNIVGIVWGAGQASGLEEFTDQIIDEARKNSEVTGVDEGEYVRLGGKQVFRRRFALTGGGLTVPGLMAGWVSPEGRMFVLYNVRVGGDEAWLVNQMRVMLRSLETVPPVEPMELESYWPTEDWRYVKPDVTGLDGYVLQGMVDEIMDSGLAVDSVLVVKDGYLVQEWYFNDYGNDVLHNVYSCTKSVVSTLVGIAVDRGEIDGVDAQLLGLFPDYAPENVDEWKESITLRDMLIMSAGFDARDSWLYEWERLGDMHDADDAVQYVLDLPMAYEPGSRFEYTNGVSHLLSCLITEKTGMSAAEYADEHLFGPLGITDYEWRTDDSGRNWGYSSLYMRPRDMAKIGYLFLNDGMWDGEQLVSESWVREATRHRIDANLRDGYGYQWWVDDDGYYLALGYMGQFIFVLPEQGIVAVFTGGTPETFDYTIELPERFIIPAAS
jgi:CubicO group peptidase (beta-lactamase class C family)